MALKKRVTAEQYAALADVLKGEYVKDGDVYVLDVDGDDRPTQADVDALKQAKQHEKEARQTVERELKALKAAGEGNSTEAETLRGELAALSERLNSRDGALKKAALEQAAGNITSKSKFPNVMKPHVLARLQADINEAGDAVVTILGADGKPSKLSFDELTTEFQKNKEFEGLMLGSQSSGGDGGKPAADGSIKAVKDMTEGERVAAAKADPQGFAQRVRAEAPAI